MKKVSLRLFCLLLVLLATHVPAMAQSMALTVISNQKGAPAELKESELRSILMGERQRWKNGYKISVALMKTNTLAGKSTCERIYHMSEDELKKFWLAQVFQGKVNPPSFFNTEEELLAFVAENPGAIGIVNLTTPARGTQVVLIEGRRSL
jgi:hypothetical protein